MLYLKLGLCDPLSRVFGGDLISAGPSAERSRKKKKLKRRLRLHRFRNVLDAFSSRQLVPFTVQFLEDYHHLSGVEQDLLSTRRRIDF